MKIRKAIGSIKQSLSKKQPQCHIPPQEIESIPNIFIPWEIYSNVDPEIFRCNQGIDEYWCDHVFIPYWFQLSENQKKKLKLQAPAKEWLDWIERVTIPENILAIREFHKKHSMPFDYRFYLKDFMIAYAAGKIFQKNLLDKTSVTSPHRDC